MTDLHHLSFLFSLKFVFNFSSEEGGGSSFICIGFSSLFLWSQKNFIIQNFSIVLFLYLLLSLFFSFSIQFYLFLSISFFSPLPLFIVSFLALSVSLLIAISQIGTPNTLSQFDHLALSYTHILFSAWSFFVRVPFYVILVLSRFVIISLANVLIEHADNKHTRRSSGNNIFSDRNSIIQCLKCLKHLVWNNVWNVLNVFEAFCLHIKNLNYQLLGQF